MQVGIQASTLFVIMFLIYVHCTWVNKLIMLRFSIGRLNRPLDLYFCHICQEYTLRVSLCFYKERKNNSLCTGVGDVQARWILGWGWRRAEVVKKVTPASGRANTDLMF